MESTLESSLDSKEVIGGLETNFVIAKSGSENNSIALSNRLSFENNQTEVNSFQLNTEHGSNLSTNGKISNINESKTSEIHNSKGSTSPKGSFMKDEELEAKASKQNTLAKTVSFRVEEDEVSEDLISVPSYISYRNSVTGNKVLQSSTSINSMITGTTTSRKNMPVLENIPEVDENVSEADEAPGYYGWDGYEARFEESVSDYVSWSSIPGCIPPWAKSIRKRYGLSPMESLDEGQVAESKGTMQEKLENLMKKHKELMLLKRVESKKQLIIEPNKDPNEMDAVKMRAKSTRYYMTPLVFDGAKPPTDDHIDDKDKVSLPSLSDSNSLSITKKTSRPQAKKEISQVLKSLQKNVPKKKDNTKDHEYKIKKENDKCPKITLSNIREFVNMSPDERKLHEIIKIEKVPSVQDIKQRNKPSSKYIINVPKNTITDTPTVNVIKIKEKRKLKVDGIENIEEKITELRYNQGGTTRPAKRESDYVHRESSDIDPRRHIKTRTKSPTETKTFEVKTRQTPLLAPLINEEDKKTEKVLLLQYDKKSKNNKHTTQLVGFKEPCTSVPGEMYLYGSETEGKKVKENLTAVRELPVTLKDKVHSIFEELRGLTLKQNVKEDIPSAEVQVRPNVAKTTQSPSHFPASTAVAMVSAKPELKSVAVQVRESQVLQGKSDSFVLVTPYPTPTSEFQGQEEIRSSLNNDTLNAKLEDLVQAKDSLGEPTLSNDEVGKDEREIEPESSQVLQKQEIVEEDKSKDKTTTGEENKSELIKPEEPVIETMKEEEKTKLEDETQVDQTSIPDQTADVPEIPGTIISDQEIKGKEIIPEDDNKETTEKVQEDTHSELSKDMPKELSMEKSKESIEQHTEEMQILPVKDETKKFSKPSTKFFEPISIVQPPQDEDFKITTTVSDEIRMSSKKSDSETDMFFKASFPKEFEDIRSYEFGSQQGTELVIKSSSKFLHHKDGLRKSKYKVRYIFYDFPKFLNICSLMIYALLTKDQKSKTNVYYPIVENCYTLNCYKSFSRMI